MPYGVRDVIALNTLPSGRREHALIQVRAVAATDDWRGAVEHCDAAIAHEQATRRHILEFRGEQHRKTDPRLAPLDAKIDRTMGGIYRVSAEASSSLDGEVAEAATRFVAKYFTEGVAWLTLLSYPEQSTEVTRLLRQMRNEDGTALALIGVLPYVERAEQLNQEFRAILETVPRGQVQYDDIRAELAEGQENLLELVAMILGRYPGRTPEQQAERVRYLRPIYDQHEAISAYYRSRRPVRDIDPQTGHELDEPALVPGAPEVVEPPPESTAATE